MNQKKIEILAPAGTMEALQAAVRCGADAVYLGGKEFNARRSAQNFGGEELAAAVEYCHVRGAQVMLTLNTVMTDDELPVLIRQAQDAAQAGVDWMIVQDLGIASLIKEICPDMKLCASTQMAVHTLDGAIQARELGMERVVLARELSASEIAAITAGCGIETEVFVHGALCMCVSGQCYLSSMIGGRSGNRGLCAQPCRLPFSSSEREYGLSLKDMSLISRMGQLQEMGVASLKIEGRMKRPEYVAAAVSACVAARDGGEVDYDLLRSVFSRSGFTSGYFDGKIGPDLFGTRQKEDVVAAAGVLDRLAALTRSERPLVPVEMSLTMKAGEPVRLLCKDRDGHETTGEGPVPQPARTRPTDEELVRRGLEKTGGTPYYLDQLDCSLDEGLMVPVSAFNALRKEALEEITCQRAAETPYYPFHPETIREAVPAPGASRRPALRIRLWKPEQYTPLVEKLADSVILPLSQLCRDDRWLDWPVAVWGELPQAAFTAGEKRMKERLDTLWEKGLRHLTAGNIGMVRLARERGFVVHGDFSLNLLNSYSLRRAKELGLADATLSFELNLGKAARLERPLPIGILAYGHLPLMIVRACPIRSREGCANCPGQGFLTDRMNNRLPVDCLEREVSRIYNDRPLWLADRPRALEGWDFLTLFFTQESPARVEEILRLWQDRASLDGRKTGGLYFRELL